MHQGASKIRTKFTARSLTHFGGIYLLHQFLQQLRLRTFFYNNIDYKQRNNRYTLSELIMALIYPMILGLEKIEVSALLKTNNVFQYITGLPSFPHPTTLRRFLIRSSELLLPQLQSVHNALRSHFICLPNIPFSFWFDCDSTVKTLYGHQEGVVRGYNPKKHGAKSYHPLLLTEAHLSDCLAALLRPGNASTTEGIKEILKNTLLLLPHHNNIRLRADAGFYDGKFIAKLRENQVHFAIAADITSPIKLKLGGLRYHKVSQVFSTAEFYYQPYKWQRKERFVVLKRKLSPKENPSNLTLFTLERYAYSVLVTDLNLLPYNVFLFYHDKAALERIIRTLKDDYLFASAPTNSFAANSLYAELSLLAYNLMNWFKRLCLPIEWQSYTLPTIRHRLLMIPGEFVKSKNIPTLRFPRNNPYQDVFYYTQNQIKKLKPLI
jgi:hypothetical protein